MKMTRVDFESPAWERAAGGLRYAAGDALVIGGEPHGAMAGGEGARVFLVEEA
jgi:hypothetical protein